MVSIYVVIYLKEYFVDVVIDLFISFGMVSYYDGVGNKGYIYIIKGENNML